MATYETLANSYFITFPNGGNTIYEEITFAKMELLKVSMDEEDYEVIIAEIIDNIETELEQ